MSAGAGRAGKAARGWAAPMRAMHWATVALLLGAYCAVWAIGAAATAADEAWLAMLHRSFGVATLALTLVRIVWRQRTGAPPVPADLPMVQRLAARANVAALYGSLVSQPLLGLAGSMLHGDRVTVFGGVVLPNVLPIAWPLARGIFRAHGWMALLLLATIGVHVAAALFHHFVRRDEVLSGMLPGTRRSFPAARPGASAAAEGSLR